MLHMLDIQKKCLRYYFHGGDLRTNRGGRVVIHFIINMDIETKLSLYELKGDRFSYNNRGICS